MKVLAHIEKPVEIEIMGVTLLSTEEAKQLPDRLRRHYLWWWLRSPGYDSFNAACVSFDGYVDSFGLNVNDDSYAVRPALTIDLKSSRLKIGDTFVFGDKRFEVISKTIAFCQEDIGNACFRRKWKTKNANDYEKSDVKKYVDDWFNESLKEAKE